MSPRFYSSLWAAFALVAAILWVGGVMSIFIGVVFGFLAFGLVFTGMICVLPGTVSHPPVQKAEKKPGPAAKAPAAALKARHV